jgi:uncharacterized protein involved in type VI secretion and phage assembly
MLNTGEDTVTDKLLDWVRNRYFGKYRGIVTDNNDSTQRGRVKVKVPAVLQDQEVWAMPCLPYTGNNVGTYTIPEPDAGVWVEFEAGDPSFPIWTGGYWVNDELPKQEDGNRATPAIRMIRSQQGLQLSFNDNSEKITISDEDGSNIITIEKGKIRLRSNMKVIVDAPAIEVVEGSSHQLVLGDSLLQYLNTLVMTFNSHIHPAALGLSPVVVSPPLVSAPPPQPTLLSTIVKAG